MKKIYLINFRNILGIILIVVFLPLQAADVPLRFDTAEQEQRYQDLIEELRCLVCQNQNLADSHADLAQDLREEVHEMILDGKNNEEIIEFLVARYGDFVLYRPPVKKSTWLLWFAPFILLVFAVYAIFRFVRSRTEISQPELSDDQREQLAQILREK